MHRLVAITSFVVALGFISAASVGGYLLFQQMSEALSAPIGQVASIVNDVAASIREPFETAAPGDTPARPVQVTTVSIPVMPPRIELAKNELVSNDKAESLELRRADIVPASVTVTEPAPAPPLGPPLEIAPRRRL